MPIATQNAQAGPSRRRQERVQASQVEEEDDVEVQKPAVTEEEGWTIETFTDVPITKSDPILTFLKGLVGKCREYVIKIEDGLSRAVDAAKLVEETVRDDEMLDEIDKEYRAGIEQREVLRIKIAVLEELQLKLRQNQPLINPIAIYTETAIRRAKEYMDQTARQKFKENEDYIEFRNAIWEVHHQGEPQPFMSTYLPMEDGDESDDEDMQVGPQTQNFRCMITLVPYVNAVTCTECNHSYSKEAIMGVLNSRNNKKKSVKCPAAGCSVTVTSAKLRDDDELQRRTDQFLKRQAAREAQEYEDDD